MRDLAKKTGISVATVSKICAGLKTDKIIQTESVGKSLLVSADINSKEYRFFKRLFNIHSLKDIVFQIDKENPSAMVLYGSYARGEDNEQSDIDIAVIGAELDLDNRALEAELCRKIHLMFFPSEKDIPKDLRTNINNGIVLIGGLL